jgi:hypothetical protein|tara:strand:- start:329 stop:502 length:174 start_codon:yes stop_codon:yes gene_type:complete
MEHLKKLKDLMELKFKDYDSFLNELYRPINGATGVQIKKYNQIDELKLEDVFLIVTD